MGVQRLGAGDYGAAATAIINAAFAEVDALRGALTEAVGRIGGKQDGFDLPGLQAGVTDALARVLRADAALLPVTRPGDSPAAFTASFAGGAPDALAPLKDADYPLTVVGDGLGRDLFASRDIWERTLHPIEPGTVWRLRWRYLRRQDSPDPASDGVVRFVAWYGPNRNFLGATTIGSDAPSAAQGAREFALVIASTALPGAIAPAEGAAYFRAGVRAYGAEQRTAVTDLGAVDVSAAFAVILSMIPADSVPNLTKAIADEVARAKAAEKDIADDLGDEVARAKAAEKDIADDLGDEVYRATAAEKALSDRADHLEGIPALGVGAVTLGAPPVEALYLTEANVIGGARAGGVRYGRQPNGGYLADPSRRPALGRGALVPGAPAADEIRLDGRGVIRSGRAGGRVQARTAAGGYTGETSRRPALGIGALGGDLVTAARLDAAGRPIAYATGGRGPVAVTYLGTPAGLIRQEVAAAGASGGVSGANTTQSGSTLVISSVTLSLLFRPFTTRGGSVTRSVPAAVAVAGELLQCRLNETAFTAYQFIGNAPVTGVRQDNGATVTEGVHFTVNRRLGQITPGAGFGSVHVPVKFSYTGYPQRAGYVSCGFDGVPVLTEGPSVPNTCSMYEPAIPAGHVAIARTFQYVDPAGVAQTELSWVYLYDGLVRRDEAAITSAVILRNRGLLPRARHKVQTDPKGFRDLGAGDSRTQFGGFQNCEGDASNPNNQNYHANVGRDSIHFLESYSAATKALIPRYSFNNGLDPNTNVKLGWNWRLLDYLARIYGVTNAYASETDLTTGGYLNFGLNGTGFDSGQFADPDNRMGGTNPARLNAQVATRPHLAVIAYGANPSSYADMPGQIETLVNAFDGVGCDCLFLLTGRPNPIWQSTGIEYFRDTCDVVRRAVNRAGHEVAYADSQRVFDPNNMGAAGLSEFEIGEGSRRNHDGVKEMRGFGNLLIELFAP